MPPGPLSVQPRARGSRRRFAKYLVCEEHCTTQEQQILHRLQDFPRHREVAANGGRPSGWSVAAGSDRGLRRITICRVWVETVADVDSWGEKGQTPVLLAVGTGVVGTSEPSRLREAVAANGSMMGRGLSPHCPARQGSSSALQYLREHDISNNNLSAAPMCFCKSATVRRNVFDGGSSTDDAFSNT